MQTEEGILQMPRRSQKGLALAIVSGRAACPVEMVMAIVMQSWPSNTNMVFMARYGMDTDAGRNASVEQALAMGMKYIWFVDDDTVPPTDAGRKLLDLLIQHGPANGEGVMVAGGVYCTRSSPPEPIIYMEPGAGSHWNWKVGETFKCWGLGTGCMMINLDVFAHLPKPWFKTTMEAEKKETDDLYFCKLVADAGFEVMAHGGVLCHHYDLERGYVYQLPRQSAPYRDRISEPSEPRTPQV